MQSARRDVCAVVTTWPFLVSLLVLLINDAWLKLAYPGLITGKLSDFAGIAIVSLLLLSVQPHRRSLVYGVVIIGFSWWKSPFSQGAIAVISSFLPVQIGRTVDYTDLVALLVIPACAAVTSNLSVFALPSRALSRLLVAPALVCTTLGLMATSVIPTRQDYQVRAIEDAPELDRDSVSETIFQVATEHGLRCKDCTVGAVSGHFIGDGISLTYTFTSARSITFQVEALPNGLFFGATGEEKADRLRDDLKARLASSHKDLEYIEQLDPNPRSTR